MNNFNKIMFSSSPCLLNREYTLTYYYINIDVSTQYDIVYVGKIHNLVDQIYARFVII